MFDIIQAIRSQGTAVFLVEQRARQALQISDRGYILDSGQVVLEGRASDLLADPQMARLYLGSSP